eukprot:XP_001706916.1 Hypothetical protein GL50803_36844 [Giardia lamblia ATCC 50803]
MKMRKSTLPFKGKSLRKENPNPPCKGMSRTDFLMKTRTIHRPTIRFAAPIE